MDGFATYQVLVLSLCCSWEAFGVVVVVEKRSTKVGRQAVFRLGYSDFMNYAPLGHNFE